MIMPNVLALKAETLDDFDITESGENVFALCTALHAPALTAHYGRNVPAPEAAVCDDGSLAFFWRCSGWPITIRLDPEQWRRAGEESGDPDWGSDIDAE